jgi:tetratricopeptide (TPR) repeat protein
MRLTPLFRLAIVCCVCAATSTLAAPDEAAEISRLMRNGQYAEAMNRVDTALVQKPSDPRLRFSKGMLLAQQNKPTEAIAVLLKLTEDFPELPEPYNNLAVLYAANGQYESARIALDKAISSNPGYATAHENLGDVYAELARQAYEKAVKLDAANAGAKSKLARFGGTSTLAQSMPATKALPASSNPQTAPTIVKTMIDKSTVATVGKPAQEDVMAVVNAWARAWSARDIKSYLGFYSEDFRTPRKMTREAWMRERTARITGKKHISVQIESPEVKLDGDSASVHFRQQFSSEQLKSTDWKTLVLARRDGQWRILEERGS